MKLQIKEIIKYSWKTLWSNSSAWAAIIGLFIVISVVQGVFGYKEAITVDVTVNDWSQYQSGEITDDEIFIRDAMYTYELFGTNKEEKTETENYVIKESSGQWIVDVIATILSLILGVATIVVSIAHVRKEKKNIIDAVKEQDFITYVRYILGSIVVTILVILGMVLLIVPGIIVALVLAFALYAIIDQKVGIFESLSVSNKMTSGHKWQLFLMILVTIGINILGALALLIGLLVAVPLTYVIWARTYDVLLTETGTDNNTAVESQEDDVIEVEQVEEGDTTKK